MGLVVEQNQFHFTQNAINYSWQQLAQRAGLDDAKVEGGIPSIHGIPFFYGHPDSISYQGRKIVVIPCQTEDWVALPEKNAHSIDWLLPEQIFPVRNIAPYKMPIPVVFWGNTTERGKAVEYHSDGTLIFNVDIFATVFFMLSRWEEMVSSTRDEHERFPASASAAYKQGFLDLPIVDLYGLILREWMREILPDWNPAPLCLKINITHDIDWISHFSSVGHFVRMAGSELIRKKSLKGLLDQSRNLYVQVAAPAQDEYFKSIYDIAEISEANGISSKFYFMSARISNYQQGYDPSSPLIQQCIKDMQQRGHEIGIHPGYGTFGDLEKLLGEKQSLEKALGASVGGGRQHFLRFGVPFTWRHWEQAGLLYDSTMGYADCEGFRCGTCYPYHPFDMELDQPMAILEVPLIVMDATLRLYRKLSPEQGGQKILELAGKCAEVGGTFTLLWHNTSLGGEWKEWGLMYRNILAELSKMKSVIND